MSTEQALEEAIRQHAIATDSLGPGEMITSWIVIGAATSADLLDQCSTSYFALYEGRDQMPQHVALGLLDVTRGHLLTGDD